MTRQPQAGAALDRKYAQQGTGAGGRHHGVGAAREMRQQLHHIVGGVAVKVSRRTARTWRGKYPVVAVVAPAIERPAVVVGGILPIAQIPPYEAVDLGLHHVPDAVRKIESVYETGRLLAGHPVDGVVLRHHDLHARAGGTEIVGELAAQCRPRRPARSWTSGANRRRTRDCRAGRAPAPDRSDDRSRNRV